ncbi:MAG: bifunctional nuclease family protein [Pyrodictiaceae archaeon]
MPPPRDSDILLKVEQIDAMITPNPPHVPVIMLEVEDGRTFTLYGVPYEIVLAINKLTNSESSITMNQRESIYDIILDFRSEISGLGKYLQRVIIDEIDYSTGLYTAKAEFMLEGIMMLRRMIPSHAIFMALLFNKPIFVRKRLVDEQEELERRVREEEEEYYGGGAEDEEI